MVTRTHRLTTIGDVVLEAVIELDDASVAVRYRLRAGALGGEVAAADAAILVAASRQAPAPAPGAGPLLTVAQVRDRLGLSARATYRVVREMTHHRIGRAIRVPVAAVMEYLAQHRTPAPATATTTRVALPAAGRRVATASSLRVTQPRTRPRG